jgi:endonuclease YncB( thermonuclease family)
MRSFVWRMMSVALLIAPLNNVPSVAQTRVTVVKVYDGDTVTLSDKSRVRLIQVDAPELAEGECYAEESRQALAKILRSQAITLVEDSKLEKVDMFGRKLGYLFAGKVNVNLKLVEIGAATPYFYNGEKGDFANKLLSAAKIARSKKLGLWNECPGTKLNPYSKVQTSRGLAVKSSNQCDPNYEGCIPVYPPDLNCSQLKTLGLAPVRVIGRDVHKLDRDGDGYGCN